MQAFNEYAVIHCIYTLLPTTQTTRNNPETSLHHKSSQRSSQVLRTRQLVQADE